MATINTDVLTIRTTDVFNVNSGVGLSQKLYLGSNVIVKDLSLYDTLIELKNTCKEMQQRITELENKNQELEERLIEVEYAPNGVMCEQAKLDFEQLAEHKD